MTVKRFQLALHDGHAIIKDGNNVILIDTGAPTTIHTSNNFEFQSGNYKCSTNYMGLTVLQISEMLGMEITTLLGADILSNYKILFDYKNKVVEFRKEDIKFEGTEMDITNFMGIPIIEVVINHKKLKCFLDTGAKLSYLSESFTNGYECIGTEKDFYPGVGKFETNCFKIPTTLGDTNFNVRYGNLPNLLQMTLMVGGTDGILGFDFFNNFTVVIDLSNNKLKYA